MQTPNAFFVAFNFQVLPMHLMPLCPKIFNPQSNPQHATSSMIFDDLGGLWQSPQSCKLL